MRASPLPFGRVAPSESVEMTDMSSTSRPDTNHFLKHALSTLRQVKHETAIQAGQTDALGKTQAGDSPLVDPALLGSRMVLGVDGLFAE